MPPYIRPTTPQPAVNTGTPGRPSDRPFTPEPVRATPPPFGGAPTPQQPTPPQQPQGGQQHGTGIGPTQTQPPPLPPNAGPPPYSAYIQPPAPAPAMAPQPQPQMAPPMQPPTAFGGGYGYAPPSHMDLAHSGPGVFETPHGTVSKAPDGSTTLDLSPQGQAVHSQHMAAEIQKFGPHPFAAFPDAPKPPISVGGIHFNPFVPGGGSWSDGYGRR